LENLPSQFAKSPLMPVSPDVVSQRLAIFCTDDDSALSMVGSIITAPERSCRQILYAAVDLTFPSSTNPIDIVLLAACFGATKCAE
jgi:hypothetical protein